MTCPSCRREPLIGCRECLRGTGYPRTAPITSYKNEASSLLTHCLAHLTPAEAWAAMTQEQRLAMAKAAPKVAGPWHTRDLWVGSYRSGPLTDAAICSPSGKAGFSFYIIRSPGWTGDYKTLEACHSACDAALIAAGWVLE